MIYHDVQAPARLAQHVFVRPGDAGHPWFATADKQSFRRCSPNRGSETPNSSIPYTAWCMERHKPYGVEPRTGNPMRHPGMLQKSLGST